MARRFLATAWAFKSAARFAIQSLNQELRTHAGPSLVASKKIHTSGCQFGLEEFFDDPKNYAKPVVRSGRAWKIDELRLKSNSDLHKLWFVLYKERNMLYTMQEAAKDENENMPSPERIDKVETSMANLEEVVMERNKAYWQLEVSPCTDGRRPRAFRRDVFGRPRWHQCSQHLVSYSRNSHFRNTQGPGIVSECDWFFRRYREMRRKLYNYERAKTARHLRDIFRRFPDADADYIAEIHPEFPPGYVQHLKANLHLYKDDRQSRLTNMNVADAMKDIDRNVEKKLLE